MLLFDTIGYLKNVNNFKATPRNDRLTAQSTHNHCAVLP